MKLKFYPGLPISARQQQRIEAAIAELAAVDNELLAEHGYELVIVRNARNADNPCFDIWPGSGPFSNSHPLVRTRLLRQELTEQSPAPMPGGQSIDQQGY